MGPCIRNSVNFRTAIILGLASGWPALSIYAGDRPGLVPLDAAAAAEEMADAPAPAGVATLDKRAGVIDAVYHTLEKVGVVQAGQHHGASEIQRTSNETPAVEAHVQAKGSSADKVKKTAVSELPLDKLTPEARQRVDSIISDMGYFRRLPTTVFAAEPEVYQFFIRYPDVAVSIWRVMGISEMKMWQTGPNEYEGDSGDGSTGIIDVLYRGADENLLICEGQYQSPMLKKPIKARSLVLLKTSFFKESDGTMYVTHRADMFVAFPSQTVETVAKVLSPLTGSMADRTFTEMSLFLRMMSLAMTRRPNWVDQIAGQMEGVPDIRKQQLRQVTLQVHNTERRRNGMPALVAKPIGPAPASLPKDIKKSAQPVASPKAGNSRGTPARPVSIKNDKPAQPDAPEEIKDADSSATDIKDFDAPGKSRLEPGYEFIPKKRANNPE